MCFGGKIDDPTQQPVRITQASQSQEALRSGSSQEKAGKTHAHTGSATDASKSINKANNQTGTGTTTLEDTAGSPVVDSKALRRKYNKRSTATGQSPGLAFDFSA